METVTGSVSIQDFLFFSQTLCLSRLVNKRKQEDGVKLVKPLDTLHLNYHLLNTMIHTWWPSYCKSLPVVLDHNRAHDKPQFFFFFCSFRGKTTILSAAVFTIFQITSRGRIPCLHLSLGRTDEKEEDGAWILLLHLIRCGAVRSLRWQDGLQRCWWMNRWDFFLFFVFLRPKSWRKHTSLCLFQRKIQQQLFSLIVSD